MRLQRIEDHPVITIHNKVNTRRARFDYLMLSDVHLDNAKCDRGRIVLCDVDRVQ